MAQTYEQKMDNVVRSVLVGAEGMLFVQAVTETGNVTTIPDYNYTKDCCEKASDSLASKNKTTATPEELAAELKRAGLNTRMWGATLTNPQIIKTQYPGEELTEMPLNQPYETLLILVEQKKWETYGPTIVKLMNFDYSGGYDGSGMINIEFNNAWTDENLGNTTPICLFRADSVQVFA